MALGPVALSLLYEANGNSFRHALLLLASANMVGASVMACVPYKSRAEGEKEGGVRDEADDEDEQLGLLTSPG